MGGVTGSTGARCAESERRQQSRGATGGSPHRVCPQHTPDKGWCGPRHQSLRTPSPEAEGGVSARGCAPSLPGALSPNPATPHPAQDPASASAPVLPSQEVLQREWRVCVPGLPGLSLLLHPRGCELLPCATHGCWPLPSPAKLPARPRGGSVRGRQQPCPLTRKCCEVALRALTWERVVGTGAALQGAPGPGRLTQALDPAGHTRGRGRRRVSLTRLGLLPLPGVGAHAMPTAAQPGPPAAGPGRLLWAPAQASWTSPCALSPAVQRASQRADGLCSGRGSVWAARGPDGR